MGGTRDWEISSVVPKHICSNKALFQSLDESVREDVPWPYGTLKAVGKGQVTLRLSTGKIFVESDVMYVPSLNKNLLSIALVTSAPPGHVVVLAGDRSLIKQEDGDLVGEVFVKGDVFVLDACVIFPTVI